MASPPRQRFWQEALAWHGSVTPLVLPRVFMFGVYSVIVCVIAFAIETFFDFKFQMQVDPFEIRCGTQLDPGSANQRRL